MQAPASNETENCIMNFELKGHGRETVAISAPFEGPKNTMKLFSLEDM